MRLVRIKTQRMLSHERKLIPRIRIPCIGFRCVYFLPDQSSNILYICSVRLAAGNSVELTKKVQGLFRLQAIAARVKEPILNLFLYSVCAGF